MATYVILNIVFLLTVTLLFSLAKLLTIRKTCLFVGLILLVLTAIFDSLIIGLNIVAYNQNKLLGLYIFRAPIEDFFYTLLAIIVVPSLWHFIRGKQHARKN